MDEQQVDQLRQQITDIRINISNALNQVSDIESQMAENYRAMVGTNKNYFETLTGPQQQQTNQQAFQELMNYRTLESVQEQLRQINLTLMNYSQDLEHDLLNVTGQSTTEPPGGDDISNNPSP